MQTLYLCNSNCWMTQSFKINSRNSKNGGCKSDKLCWPTVAKRLLYLGIFLRQVSLNWSQGLPKNWVWTNQKLEILDLSWSFNDMVGANCFSLKAKFYEEHITVVLWSLLFKLCVNLQLDLTFIDEFE